jgi:hypothetical protein
MNPGVHAAVIAAHERRRQEEMWREEEAMFNYSQDDIQGEWEFKIVRSGSTIFRKREVLEQVMEEEALSGWQMVEKLDDSRLRFKRPIAARRRDAMLPEGIDPYRSQVGSGSAGIAAVLFGLSTLVVVGIALVFANAPEGAGEIPWILIALIATLIVGFGMIAVVVRGRR